MCSAYVCISLPTPSEDLRRCWWCVAGYVSLGTVPVGCRYVAVSVWSDDGGMELGGPSAANKTRSCARGSSTAEGTRPQAWQGREEWQCSTLNWYIIAVSYSVE